MIKIILITFSAAISVVVFVASMFLNSILGAFGLVSTSLDTFNNLHETKQIMDVVKKRHKTKKLNASKRFVKRTTQKVAASAASAIIPGIAVGTVMVTVIALEAVDYCNHKEELHNDGNILFGTDNSFDYDTCMNEAKNDASEIMTSAKKAVPELVSSTWNDTKNISIDTWEATKGAGLNAWSITSSKSEKIWSSLINWTE